MAENRTFLLCVDNSAGCGPAERAERLATASDGFSGAEIEQAILSGLYTAFSQQKQLDTPTLLNELHATQPLSVTRAEDIQAIRDWARTRAVPAD